MELLSNTTIKRRRKLLSEVDGRRKEDKMMIQTIQSLQRNQEELSMRLSALEKSHTQVSNIHLSK